MSALKFLIKLNSNTQINVKFDDEIMNFQNILFSGIFTASAL